MGSDYLTSPLIFILTTLFDLYILLVILRFMLQWLRADFYNPVSQFIVRATTPPLRPLRRIIPSVGSQDSSSIVLAVLLTYIKYMLLKMLSVPAIQIGGAVAPIASTSTPGLLIFCLADLISLTLTIFLVAIIIQVVISWVNPGQYNPVVGLIHQITAPVMRPVQRFIPSMGGIDLSPLIASMILIVAKMLIIPPLIHLARF